jgi:hypothetical protein
LIERPLIAALPLPHTPVDTTADDAAPAIFRAIRNAASDSRPAVARSDRSSAWTADPDDDTCSVSIHIDYDDLWRGREKEILENVRGTVEGQVTFLTDAQKCLLKRSPGEFLELTPRPESAELVAFETELVGGSERVVRLTLAEPPASPGRITHVAIIPNMVHLERQLEALTAIEDAADDGPLAPLRALVGLGNAAQLSSQHGDAGTPAPALPESGERLDGQRGRETHPSGACRQ